MKKVYLFLLICLNFSLKLNAQKMEVYAPNKTLLPKTWYQLIEGKDNGTKIEPIYLNYLSIAYLLDYHPGTDNPESKIYKTDSKNSDINEALKSSLGGVLRFSKFSENSKYLLFPVLQDKFLIEKLITDVEGTVTTSAETYTNVKTIFKINSTDKEYYSYTIRFYLKTMSFYIMALSDKKGNPISAEQYEKVKAFYEKDLHTQLQKILSFANNKELVSSYHQEYIDLYGKEWDKVLELRREEFLKKTAPTISKEEYHQKKKQEAEYQGMNVNKWGVSKDYFPLEGIWFIQTISYSDCKPQKSNCFDLQRFQKLEYSEYDHALAFFRNNSGEWDIFENKNCTRPIYFMGFNKIEGSVTTLNDTVYKIYLKGCDTEFKVKIIPNKLDSLIIRYYNNQISLSEVQTLLYNESKRATYWQRELLFPTVGCEHNGAHFLQDFPNYLTLFSAADLSNEKPGMKIIPSSLAEKEQEAVQMHKYMKEAQVQRAARKAEEDAKQAQAAAKQAEERERERQVFLNLEEGDMICAKETNCYSNDDECLIVSAFVEGWNQSRSKYKIRIYTVNSGSTTYSDAIGVYGEVDGVRYHIGEIIWVDFTERPMTTWVTCRKK